MAPMLSRFESEFLTPLIEATIKILYKWHYVDMPTKGVGGIGIDIEFISPIAQAQKATEIQNAVQFWGSLKEIYQTDPKVLDNVNLDNLLRNFGNLYKVDSSIMMTEKEVEAIRRQRQQDEQRQQEQQQEQEFMKQLQGQEHMKAGQEEGLGGVNEIE
jgi:hypothetical protein